MKRFMGALTMAMLSFCLCADGVFTVTQYNLKTCIETLDGIEYAIYRPGSRVERQATKTYSQLAFVSGDVQSQGEPHFYGSMVHIPLSRGSSGCFAVKVDGIITIPESGYWTFAFGSDDGFRAEISGHGVLEKSSSVDLRTFETTLHKVLFENPGKYNFRLIWFTRGYDNAPGDLAGLEVSIAQGSYSSFNASAFKLLKASSEGLSYEVRFDANGGTGEMAGQVFEGNDRQKLSKSLYRKDGYVFQGWAVTANGEVVYKDEAEITVDSDMTLYAVWEANQVVVHFDANGGVFRDKDGNVLKDANGNPAKEFDQHFTYGESKPLFTDELTPMRMDGNGNIFLGWSKGTPNISSSDQVIASGREWTWDDDETEVTFYAVWTTTVTVWFYNEETTSGDKSLSPSSLADHLWWSVDDGATGTPKTLRSGETIEVSPGYRTVTFHGDNAYYWIAGLRTVDGVAVDTFKLNICNDYTDALFGSTPSRKGISLYVKVEPPSGTENTASVRFLCSNEIRESLRDRINAADVPFDPSKVRITIGRADYNASGFLVPMMAYSLTGLEAYRTYYLPKGHYYVKYEDVTYDVDTSGGEPYWGAALESNFERQLFELSDEDNEAVKKITVRFDMFGGRNAVRVEFDPQGGECAKSEMWFTYHEGNYQPGPRIDKTLPTPEREGFEFSGWFTAKSGGQWKKEGSDISDCTLFAHWTGMTREWMEENARALFPDLADLDVATVANTAAANGCRTVGECYALGIDPEDPDDDLKIAEFKMKDGKPEITLNHTKDGSGNSFEDRVKILGKAELTDAEWQEVPPEGNPAHRFFKVGVEMP